MSKAKEEKPCFVYVLATVGKAGDCSPTKIGIASNPETRLATIKTACPNQICMQMFFGPMHREYARYIEKEAHTLYKRFRLHGEWFDVDPQTAVDLIADIITVVCTRDVADEIGRAKTLTELGVYAARMRSDPYRNEYP